jgi:hypothetical protein
MSLGVAEMSAEMVAMLPEAPLLMMALAGAAGTFVRLQFPAVFQSVLVPPIQELSWALAAERLMAARALVTREIPRRERWNLGVLVWSFMEGLDVRRWVRSSLTTHGCIGKNG